MGNRTGEKLRAGAARCDSVWPDDEQMVALMAEHQSLTKLAQAFGRTTSGLRNYLAIRPELRARWKRHVRFQLARPGGRRGTARRI